MLRATLNELNKHINKKTQQGSLPQKVEGVMTANWENVSLSSKCFQQLNLKLQFRDIVPACMMTLPSQKCR